MNHIIATCNFCDDVGSVIECFIPGGTALADLTVLQQPVSSLYQFVFYYTLHNEGYIESFEHELTSCLAMINLNSQDTSLVPK